MTGEEVRNLIAVIDSLWPRRRPLDTTEVRVMVRTWTAVLRDVPYDDAEAAVLAAAHRGDHFPPAVAEVLDEVHTVIDARRGELCPDVNLALAEVQHYVRQRGAHRGPPDDDVWSHPVVLATVKAFTWNEVCQGGDTWRAHFLRGYAEARTSWRRRTRTPDRFAGELAPAREPSRAIPHRPPGPVRTH